MRGADATMDGAVLVIGYRQDALAELAQDELGPAQLEQRGASAVVRALYRLDYSLTEREAGA